MVLFLTEGFRGADRIGFDRTAGAAAWVDFLGVVPADFLVGVARVIAALVVVVALAEAFGVAAAFLARAAVAVALAAGLPVVFLAAGIRWRAIRAMCGAARIGIVTADTTPKATQIMNFLENINTPFADADQATRAPVPPGPTNCLSGDDQSGDE